LQVNILEAKSQLSRLVKQALEGEDVVIASNGEPLVRLVPIAGRGRLRGWGRLKKFAAAVGDAFSPEVDAAVWSGPRSDSPHGRCRTVALAGTEPPAANLSALLAVQLDRSHTSPWGSTGPRAARLRAPVPRHPRARRWT
jgi:prevent-host-death family protein